MENNLLVSNTDIGNQNDSDASLQLDAIFRAFPDFLFSINADGQILDYRAGKMSALYLPPEQFLDHKIQDVLPAEIGSKFDRALRETFKTGKVVSIEYLLQVPEGERWFEARLVPLDKSRVIAIVRDVTERVKNAQQIQSQLRRLSALHAVDAAITASFDLNVTLSVILRQMINQLGVDAVDILVFNPTTRMLEFAAGQGFQTKRPQPLSLMIGQGYAGKAALERRTISVPNLESQPAGFLFSPNFVQEKFANYCAVPLIAKGQVKGVLEIYQRSLLHPDDDWLDFLATIASQAAVAIDSASLFQDLQRTNAELSLAYDAAIESWAQVLELSNRESGAHAYRVVDLTLQLARSMGVDEDKLVHFRRGALLHDVGKLGISESILNKPGPLDEAEREIMHGHPRLAHQLLLSVNYLAPALDIPHYHHERWDGSGYPDGLRAEQIPFSARLFAVVDVYDALTSIRPYRSAWPRQAALEHIDQQSGKLFDPAVVKAFLQVMRER
jgi:HD-GYP domain-containing protein (c-di-GMP phosphodiesterase class II)